MINKVFICFLAGFLGFALIGGGFAQASIFEDSPQELKLFAGDIEIIEVDNLRRVSVRNPNIADVTKAESNEIIISAKAKGTTYLSFWDKKGRHQIKIRVFSKDMGNIHQQVKEVLEALDLNSVYTRLLKEEGRILLLGTVRNAGEKARIVNALGGLGGRITDLTKIEEDKLVEISVQVLELREGATERLGFDMPSSLKISEIAPVPSSSWGEFFKLGELSRNQLNFTLDLLVQEGKARILSRPKLVCQSGKEAELLVGGEKPIFETTVAAEGAEGTSVSYREYGIKLNMSPIVIGDDRVELLLGIEVTDVGESEVFGGDKAQAFPLTTRSINTSLYLDDQETLVMGGLITEKSEEELRKMPWLSEVPILGTFFRHKEKRKGGGFGEAMDKELFVTLTPRIIHPREKALPEKTKEEIEPWGYDYLLAEPKPKVPSELEDYVLGVQRVILSRTSYPASLIGTGWEGELLLEIEVNRVGQLKKAEVIRSSGYKIFDEQALRLVKDLTFPSFPTGASQKEIKVAIPVVYTER